VGITLPGRAGVQAPDAQLDLSRGRARRPEGPHDVEQPLLKEAQAIVILASWVLRQVAPAHHSPPAVRSR
jgi:hypothetical protein